MILVICDPYVLIHRIVKFCYFVTMLQTSSYNHDETFVLHVLVANKVTTAEYLADVRSWYVCATYREGGLSRIEQLVGYFYSATPLGVAYCLAVNELQVGHA